MASALRQPAMAPVNRSSRAGRRGLGAPRVPSRPSAATPSGQPSQSGGSTQRARSASSSANAASVAPLEQVAPSGPYCTVPPFELRRAPFFQRLLCSAGIACPTGYSYEAPRQWAGRVAWATPSGTGSGLPAEVEPLAYFTDGPGSEVEKATANGPLSWWRYQGIGL